MKSETKLQLEVSQSPFNTCWLGVIHGACQYFGLEWQPSDVFVYSGHAFMTSVRNDLCPSSPYVWNVKPVQASFENLGLKVEDIAFVIPANETPGEHQQLNEDVKRALDTGKLVGIENKDHQLVQGYDENGFLLTQPWDPGTETTPPRLEYDNWGNHGGEVPVHAYSIEHIAGPAPDLNSVIDLAIDMWDNPTQYQMYPEYKAGSGAYKNFILGIDSGFGEEHGAWWNGVVWSECKLMAARFFEHQVAEPFANSRSTRDLSMNYRIAGYGLMTASNKEKSNQERKRALERSCLAEERAVAILRRIRESL